MSELDRQLAVVAARQHSLITLGDVIAAGGTKSHASDRVLTGRWEAALPGVYRLAGVPWTYEARVLGLVLYAGPGALASHMCAARLLGLGFTRAAPEISIQRGRNRRPTGLRVHESTDLDRCGVRIVDGIPVTDPARTLLDLGRYVGPQALRRAVEQARRHDLVTWTQLIQCLAAHARQGRHGIRRLRLVIASRIASDEVTDTDSELMALTLIREHGLPEPTVHHRVYDGDLLIAELDLAYEELLIALEIDGTVHLDPATRRKDDARDHELRRRGWTVRRIWYEIPVQQPSAFVQIVQALLSDADERHVAA